VGLDIRMAGNRLRWGDMIIDVAITRLVGDMDMGRGPATVRACRTQAITNKFGVRFECSRGHPMLEVGVGNRNPSPHDLIWTMRRTVPVVMASRECGITRGIVGRVKLVVKAVVDFGLVVLRQGSMGVEGVVSGMEGGMEPPTGVGLSWHGMMGDGSGVEHDVRIAGGMVSVDFVAWANDLLGLCGVSVQVGGGHTLMLVRGLNGDRSHDVVMREVATLARGVVSSDLPWMRSLMDGCLEVFGDLPVVFVVEGGGVLCVSVDRMGWDRDGEDGA